MLLAILYMIFGQQINFMSQCDSGKCVIDNIPFGIGREAVKWQMKYEAPSAMPRTEHGGEVVQYDDYKFNGDARSFATAFIFNGDGLLRGIVSSLVPSSDDYEYPEVFNLYMEMRDRIQSSGLYDSIEFVYSFKEPYYGTDEREAISGNFSGSEASALEQDRNGVISKYRFGKVWAVFQNKDRHSLKILLAVVQESGNRKPSVHVEYIDTRYGKGGGYVYGIDTTITRR